MTKKEIVNRNIGLTFDFIRYLIDHPDEINNLPDNFKLEFIEKDFPKVESKQKNNSHLITKFVKVNNSFEIIK